MPSSESALIRGFHRIPKRDHKYVEVEKRWPQFCFFLHSVQTATVSFCLSRPIGKRGQAECLDPCGFDRPSPRIHVALKERQRAEQVLQGGVGEAMWGCGILLELWGPAKTSPLKPETPVGVTLFIISTAGYCSEQWFNRCAKTTGIWGTVLNIAGKTLWCLSYSSVPRAHPLQNGCFGQMERLVCIWNKVSKEIGQHRCEHSRSAKIPACQ